MLDEAIDRASTPLALARAAAGALRAPGPTLRRARERAASVSEALRTALYLPSATVLERPIGPHRRAEWRVFDLAEIKALGQQLGGAFFLSLPVWESDPLARFQAVRTETARLKHGGDELRWPAVLVHSSRP